jgi:hypothetical protein
MIAVVVAEADPVYHRNDDEDVDGPPALSGEAGWLHQARVRPATVAEAGPLLVVQTREDRRHDVARRRADLFTDARDGTSPAEVDLTHAVRIPFGAELRSTPLPQLEDQLWVELDGAAAWWLQYGGSDNMCSNYGSFIATRLPLTPQRAELVSQLRAEYEVPTFAAAGIGEAAARALIGAGWDCWRALTALGLLSLTSAEDAAVFLAKPESWWERAGWTGSRPLAGGAVLPVTSAVRLAEAGISHYRAEQLRSAGHATLEQMLTATAPVVPDEPGRFILRTPEGPDAQARITSDPELARAFVRERPAFWWDGAVHHTPGIAPVHVATRQPGDRIGMGAGWVLWDDGSLVCRIGWLSLWDSAEGRARCAPAPAGLSPAAAHAVGLVASCGNVQAVPRSVWHPLREAVEHTETVLDNREHTRSSWTEFKALLRHDYRLPDGTTAHLWQLRTGGAGMANGDGDFRVDSMIWPSESPARDAYRAHRLR